MMWRIERGVGTNQAIRFVAKFRNQPKETVKRIYYRWRDRVVADDEYTEMLALASQDTRSHAKPDKFT